ncbi:MAG: glycosyltransferase family 2 protein [Deltaproteobacteria bacterium]|nr:glycosyltransferase family 2 protein [Deltaproteobacteria bacterium]
MHNNTLHRESQDFATPTAIPHVSVVLPVYNEEASLGQELRLIQEAMEGSEYTYEVIVVDDGSEDRTALTLQEYPWVRLIRHRYNKGSGAARKAGTLAARGEIVVWSDADLTYPNHLIPDLVRFMEEQGYDQVVGARQAEKGRWPVLRVPAKYLIRRLACFLADTEIPDLNSGLRAFRRDVALRYIDLLPRGFSCVTTITLAFLCNGYRVGYWPIQYKSRVGQSKFHPIKDTYRYAMQVTRMVMCFDPLRVFLPLSLLFVLGGILLSLAHYAQKGTIQEMDVIVVVVGVLIGVVGLLADLVVLQTKRLERFHEALAQKSAEKTDF